MKAALKAVAGIAAVAAMTAVSATSAVAHEANGPPAIDCDKVSVELEGFPQGSSTITFHVTVNGTTSTKTTQFTGPSGTATASLSDLTNKTGSLNIAAYASWAVDGGGQSETAKVAKVCHETPKQPPNRPPTQPPISVGGVTATAPPISGGGVTATAPPISGAGVTATAPPISVAGVTAEVTRESQRGAPAGAVTAPPGFTG